MPATSKPNTVGDAVLAARRQELRLLDELLDERKRYFKQQEAQINDLVESGNTELMALHHAIIMAKAELKQLKTEIRLFRTDKHQMERDLQVLQVEMARYDDGNYSIGLIQVSQGL